MTWLQAIERQLLQHEGLRTKPYVDTVGKVTIGVGHNLTDNGLTREQCMAIFREDLVRAINDVAQTFPWFKRLDETRQAVLVDMAFNLGIAGLAKFGKALSAIRAGQYQDAAMHMLQSRWAEQVGNRALTLAAMMETGINPFRDDT